MAARDAVLQALAMTHRDERELAQALFESSIRCWERVVTQEAQGLGLPGVAHLEAPPILDRLQKRAGQAAGWITGHYNDALTEELDRAGARFPERDDLLRHALEWDEKRQEWKSEQIAVTEAACTANGALLDFYRKNGLDVEVRVLPHGAVCKVCQQLVAGQPYTLDEAESLYTGLPAHIHCPHLFVMVPKGADPGRGPEEGAPGRGKGPGGGRRRRWPWPRPIPPIPPFLPLPPGQDGDDDDPKRRRDQGIPRLPWLGQGE